MDTKLNETLSQWTTPRLMRLNQADGTNKHVVAAESVTITPGALTCNGGTDTDGAYGGGPCGPS